MDSHGHAAWGVVDRTKGDARRAGLRPLRAVVYKVAEARRGEVPAGRRR